jgi:hypothetical protein
MTKLNWERENRKEGYAPTEATQVSIAHSPGHVWDKRQRHDCRDQIAEIGRIRLELEKMPKGTPGRKKLQKRLTALTHNGKHTSKKVQKRLAEIRARTTKKGISDCDNEASDAPKHDRSER